MRTGRPKARSTLCLSRGLAREEPLATERRGYPLGCGLVTRASRSRQSRARLSFPAYTAPYRSPLHYAVSIGACRATNSTTSARTASSTGPGGKPLLSTMGRRPAPSVAGETLGNATGGVSRLVRPRRIGNQRPRHCGSHGAFRHALSPGRGSIAALPGGGAG